MPNMLQQLLRKGQHTKAQCHVGGYSIIIGQRCGGREADTVCVPAWARHEQSHLESA